MAKELRIFQRPEDAAPAHYPPGKVHDAVHAVGKRQLNAISVDNTLAVTVAHNCVIVSYSLLKRLYFRRRLSGRPVRTMGSGVFDFARRFVETEFAGARDLSTGIKSVPLLGIGSVAMDRACLVYRGGSWDTNGLNRC